MEMANGNPAHNFFSDLASEVEFLAKGAERLQAHPCVGHRLTYLKTVARDLEDHVQKQKISAQEARYTFETELQDFIAFLNGRLD